MKVKVKELVEGCMPEVIDKGDWIDLKSAADIQLEAPQAGVQYQAENKKLRDVNGDTVYIPLGVAMKLPKGFEAHVVVRSSTPKKWGFVQANSIGIIDETYCGDDDQWMLPALPFRSSRIPKLTRICQFRIQLSQKATFWQKLKWLFSSKIELVKVDNLEDENRGGLGSTN